MRPYRRKARSPLARELTLWIFLAMAVSVLIGLVNMAFAFQRRHFQTDELPA